MRTAFVKSFSFWAFYCSEARNPKTEARIESIIVACNGIRGEIGEGDETGEWRVGCDFPSREDAIRACDLLRGICFYLNPPRYEPPKMPDAIRAAVWEHVEADYLKLSEEAQENFDFDAALEAAVVT